MICRQLFGRSQYSMLMIRVIRDAKVSSIQSFVRSNMVTAWLCFPFSVSTSVAEVVTNVAQSKPTLSGPNRHEEC